MQAIRPIQIILLICMLAAAAGAYYLTPTIKMAEQHNYNFEAMIPTQFGEWQLEPDQGVVELPAELQESLKKSYTAILSRTYKNKAGERVMLSIAYGAEQSDAMGVHRPDVCYPAQGFSIANKELTQLTLNNKTIPVNRMVATQGTRIEPLTYWTLLGNVVTKDAREHKIEQIKYGLGGTIPDGLIFRVSSLGSDASEQYQLQDRFLNDLFASQSKADWLLGS